MSNTTTSICNKPWCKATFIIPLSSIEVDVDGNENWPRVCPKCASQEESITWNEKEYEGDRWDGTPHEFRYKINKYY